MDFRERIKRDPNGLQKLAEAIPGFSGYQEREQRRGADKLLREHLAGEIDALSERIERIATRWARAGNTGHLADLEAIAGRLRRGADRLRYASYGYSGFFDLVKIDEEDLQRFYEYDLSLRGFIADIRESIDELTEAQEDEIVVALDALDEAIDALAEMIDQRENVATDLAP